MGVVLAAFYWLRLLVAALFNMRPNLMCPGRCLIDEQHLPLQLGAVECTRREHRQVDYRSHGSFEDVRTLSTVALDTCISGTKVRVELPIASASSSLPRC